MARNGYKKLISTTGTLTSTKTMRGNIEQYIIGGNGVQETPSLSSPKPFVSLGESGSIEVNVRSGIYGVNFHSESNPIGIRTYEAVCLSAGVEIGGVMTAPNDFDNISIFNRPICCCSYNSALEKWIVNAYKGEPDFASDGSNGEVMRECTPFYWNGSLDNIIISETQAAGLTLAPCFKSVNQKAYAPVYWLAKVGGVATSRSGIFPEYNSLNGSMTSARTFNASAYTETIEWLICDLVLQLVEFATRDLQTVMLGAMSLPYTNTHKITTVISNSEFTVTAAVGSGYVVGQSIAIGSTEYGSNRAINTQITSITTNDGVSTITISPVASNLAVDDYISSRAYINGYTDTIMASSGTAINGGKHPCIWRGKVDPWAGGFSQLSNALTKRSGSGTTEDPYTYGVYYLPDPTKYNNGAITADYILTQLSLPTADGYIKTLGRDNRFNFLRITDAIGGGSTTYWGAYYYYPRYDICAIRAGGHFSSGRSCSPVCFNCADAPSGSGVNSLARLFL